MSRRRDTTCRWAGESWFVAPGAFRPRKSSYPMLGLGEAVLDREPQVVTLVDLCCGVGNLGLAIARSRQAQVGSVVLADRSAAALKSARANLEMRHMKGEVRSWRAGEVLNVAEPAVFVCNPPFLPLSDVSPNDACHLDAIAGGADGLDVIHELMAGLRGLRGRLLLKSLASQVGRIRVVHDADFALESVAETTTGIAFSTWCSRKWVMSGGGCAGRQCIPLHEGRVS